MNLMNLLRKFHREESGQDTVEYVLIGAAVVAAIVLGGPSINAMLTSAISTLASKVQAAI